MTLTPAQNATLKAAIQADQTLAPLVAINDWPAVANALNAPFAPAFMVWRTNVSRAEIYHQHSAENTDWDWTIYMSQTVPQQGAWTQMFMGDQVNMSLPNLRVGIEKIYGVSNACTTHAKAIGKRAALYGEKIFATGTGSLAAPGVMTFEGILSPADVQAAMK